MADEFALQMAAILDVVPVMFRIRDEGICRNCACAGGWRGCAGGLRGCRGVWRGGGYAWRDSHPFTVMRPIPKTHSGAQGSSGAVFRQPRLRALLVVRQARRAPRQCELQAYVAIAVGASHC